MFEKIATIVTAGFALATMPLQAEDNLITNPADGIIQIEQVAAGSASEQEFSNLFASWEALEQGGVVTRDGLIAPASPRPGVSIPSRMPVEDVRLTSGYGMRDHPILQKRRHHNGVDLAAAQGTPVYATADGMVGKAQYWGSYGNYVQIEHGGELETRYAHLSSYTVSMGDTVHKGDLIGYIGTTGRSTGPHLHYEVRVAGEPVDPRPYMVTGFALVEDDEGGMGGAD